MNNGEKSSSILSYVKPLLPSAPTIPPRYGFLLTRALSQEGFPWKNVQCGENPQNSSGPEKIDETGALTVESARAVRSQNMTRGAWMCRQYDDGLKIWLAAPRENEKPFIDSERAQKWRLSLASLLFFTVLLSDHLWFCAEAKLTRTRDKEQRQRRQQQRQRQHEPSWPALLASMGESSPAAQAHRLLSASSSPTLPPSPGGGGGGGGTRGKNNRSKALFLGNSAKPAWRLETCYPQGASSGQCFTVESADAVCARNWSRGVAAAGEGQPVRGTHPAPLWNLSDFYLSFCNSYTLGELFSGLSSPSTLNCSLDVVLKEGGEMTTCRQCVEAYQDYDHHAQEKYEEFESVLHKYLQSEEYSVKSCPEDCKNPNILKSVAVTWGHMIKSSTGR
ncbi:hypothetical protein GH733_006498 [Mirounga leonina]|nr:hypothetical protein GH733_006498 [Mirounga leonina]